jgi:hypothetical protein
MFGVVELALTAAYARADIRLLAARIPFLLEHIIQTRKPEHVRDEK